MRTKNPMAKKPAAILFSKNVYHYPVKVANWQCHLDTQPKDHDVYRDQLSNHVSTFDRLGSDDQGVRTTETREMLKQVFGRLEPVFAHQPLVNFTSYPCTDTPGRNKLMQKTNIPQLHPEFGVMDYLTTQQDDYRNPSPGVLKPLTMATPPWLLNRLVRSDTTQSGGTAPPPGRYQCLDEHTPIHHIRALRLPRYQSFNPVTCARDFPAVDPASFAAAAHAPPKETNV